MHQDFFSDNIIYKIKAIYMKDWISKNIPKFQFSISHGKSQTHCHYNFL